jgi:anthranilate synthase/aminodeoxychorismate synthase-like glutamine amidotransferase
MILVIDNFDSFVFNLARYVVNTGKQVQIVRNNELQISDVILLNPSHIIISPGPGTPNNAGISLHLVQQLYTKYPILGVCLGHQVIGQAFGAAVVRAKTPMHGKASLVNCSKSRLFAGLPSKLTVGRYHSLIVEQSDISQQVLTTTAYCNDNQIMAIEHNHFPVYGIQFHPESILTEYGVQIIENFLQTKR